MRERLRTTLLPIIAAFIWGVAFVAQKGNQTGALTFNASRSIIAFLFLLIVIAIFTKGDFAHLLRGQTREETKAIWLGGVCCGLALAFATFLQQYGLDAGTEAGKASFLTALYVVLVPVVGLFLKKRAGYNVWIAIVIAVVGLYFICVKGDFSISGADIFVLACAFVFTCHILLIDHFSPKCSGLKLSCVQFLVCFAASAAVALVFESPSIVEIKASLWPILYLGVMSSGVAYTLQIIAQRNANPTLLAILLSLESVFGALGGAVLLGEVLTGREYLGCALVLIAVVISQLPGKKRAGDQVS
ncbi:MAG: DMT family transporter [bacterium]|nr:DMT family transporter [bacterium]